MAVRQAIPSIAEERTYLRFKITPGLPETGNWKMEISGTGQIFC
jgi:hypothetical protein